MLWSFDMWFWYRLFSYNTAIVFYASKEVCIILMVVFVAQGKDCVVFDKFNFGRERILFVSHFKGSIHYLTVWNCAIGKGEYIIWYLSLWKCDFLCIVIFLQGRAHYLIILCPRNGWVHYVTACVPCLFIQSLYWCRHHLSAYLFFQVFQLSLFMMKHINKYNETSEWILSWKELFIAIKKMVGDNTR